MISCPRVRKSDIRLHYDLATAFYRLLWGEHIHHGLWTDDEPPAEAQRRLIEAAAARATLRDGDEVLDVGCGMGGSSVYLAKRYGCRVTGVTLSPVQRCWAAAGSLVRGARSRTRFLRGDAETIELAPRSFDVLWSIECTEHLFDKPRFFQRAAGWLKPGGRLMICAWLAGDEPLDEAARRRVFDVCEGFLCPSLGSRLDYETWFAAAGLRLTSFDDWTDRVARTWEICRDRVRRTGVRHLSRLLHRGSTLFLDRFDAILEAYRTRSMLYGCFSAKLAAPTHPRPARGDDSQYVHSHDGTFHG